MVLGMYKVYQKIILACLLLVMTGTVYSQRVTQTINDGWKFSLFEGDASTADFDISGWTDVSIPHTWNAKDADDEIPGYFRGKGWYRKVVTVEELIPEAQSGDHSNIATIGVAVGFTIMMILDVALG